MQKGKTMSKKNKKVKKIKKIFKQNTANDLFTSMKAAGIPITVPLDFMIGDQTVVITPHGKAHVCSHCGERSDENE